MCFRVFWCENLQQQRFSYLSKVSSIVSVLDFFYIVESKPTLNKGGATGKGTRTTCARKTLHYHVCLVCVCHYLRHQTWRSAVQWKERLLEAEQGNDSPTLQQTDCLLESLYQLRAPCSRSPIPQQLQTHTEVALPSVDRVVRKGGVCREGESFLPLSLTVEQLGELQRQDLWSFLHDSLSNQCSTRSNCLHSYATGSWRLSFQVVMINHLNHCPLKVTVGTAIGDSQLSCWLISYFDKPFSNYRNVLTWPLTLVCKIWFILNFEISK